jgi:predicted nuclease with TOPRIM domain
MFCRDLVKIGIFVLVSLASSFSIAQEKVEDQPEQKSAIQTEWFELQARLQVLKAKIKAKNDVVRKLIQNKQLAKEEKQAVAVVNELKTEYRDLQATIREYEEQRAQLNYRFPEKGRMEEPVKK